MLLVLRRGSESSGLGRWREDLLQRLQQRNRVSIFFKRIVLGRRPTETIDTLATMGREASMVSSQGVIPTEKRRDDAEKALSPRTVIFRGPW